MKNKLKLLFTVASIAFLGASCEDENNFAISQPVGSFNIMTPSNGQSVILTEATPNNAGITLSWAAADFGTQAVISYTTQIAQDGSNFANPIDLGTTFNRFDSFQTAQFNLACLMSGAVP